MKKIAAVLLSFVLAPLLVPFGVIATRAQDDSPDAPPEMTITALDEGLAPSRVYTREDILIGAQACVHEATWAGGVRTFDCGGIVQVVESRRRADESFAHALARTMPRFYARTTSRAWTRALEAGPMRRNPPGWPYEVHVLHYDDEWHAVYRRTAAFMRGEEPLPCSPEPTHWLGRRADHERLEERLAIGEWAEANCGTPFDGDEHATVNAFLYRVDRD